MRVGRHAKVHGQEFTPYRDCQGDAALLHVAIRLGMVSNYGHRFGMHGSSARRRTSNGQARRQCIAAFRGGY